MDLCINTLKWSKIPNFQTLGCLTTFWFQWKTEKMELFLWDGLDKSIMSQRLKIVLLVLGLYEHLDSSKQTNTLLIGQQCTVNTTVIGWRTHLHIAAFMHCIKCTVRPSITRLEPCGIAAYVFCNVSLLNCARWREGGPRRSRKRLQLRGRRLWWGMKRRKKN